MLPQSTDSEENNQAGDRRNEVKLCLLNVTMGNTNLIMMQFYQLYWKCLSRKQRCHSYIGKVATVILLIKKIGSFEHGMEITCSIE